MTKKLITNDCPTSSPLIPARQTQIHSFFSRRHDDHMLGLTSKEENCKHSFTLELRTA